MASAKQDYEDVLTAKRLKLCATICQKLVMLLEELAVAALKAVCRSGEVLAGGVVWPELG